MFTGIILAGGDERMDEKKIPLLYFRNERLIMRQIDEMKKICREIIIVTNEPHNYLPIVPREVRIITDFYKKRGPIGGMHAGFSLATNDLVWVVSCDMPFLSAAAAEWMADRLKQTGADVVIPVLNGKAHPYYGVYERKDTLNNIVDMIDRGKSKISSLLEKIDCVLVSERDLETNRISPLFVYRIHSLQEMSEAESW